MMKGILFKKNLSATIALISALIFISGCKTVAEGKAEAAVITNISPEIKKELIETLALALNGIQVKLADNVLTQSDKLIIARKLHRNLQNDPVMGRSYEMPYHFNLIKIRQICFLVDQQTNKKYRLDKTRCQPLKQKKGE